MNKPTASNRSNDPAGQLLASDDDGPIGTKPGQSRASSAPCTPRQDAALSSLAEQLQHDATRDAEAYVARSDTRQVGE